MPVTGFSSVLRVTKALADAQRVRLVSMLSNGELCGCQVVEVLGLAPSTVSKHLSVLATAGLVVSRKQGRWAYYRLPEAVSADPIVWKAIEWVQTSLHNDAQVLADRGAIARVTACDPA